MSRAEQYSWASLVATGLVFFWFTTQMLDGWSLAAHTPQRLFWIYVMVIVATIVAEAIVAGTLASLRRKGGDTVLADERDREIEAKAGRYESYFVIAAINVVVFQTLATEAFAGNALEAGYRWLLFDVATPAGMLFTLFWILYGGHFVKLVATIVHHRV